MIALVVFEQIMLKSTFSRQMKITQNWNLEKDPAKGERANPDHEHGEDIVDEWHLSLSQIFWLSLFSFTFFPFYLLSLCLREKALFPLSLTLTHSEVRLETQKKRNAFRCCATARHAASPVCRESGGQLQLWVRRGFFLDNYDAQTKIPAVRLSHEVGGSSQHGTGEEGKRRRST